MTAFAILMRHGIAHPRGSMPEEERSLTGKGRRRMKEVARGLAAIRPSIDVIYSSPLLRCMQTAQSISDQYELGFHAVDELRPDAKPQDLRGLLDRTSGRIVVCIGHEPTLSAMMLDLTGMTGEVELKKGGCYGVSFGEGRPRLEWMVPPRVLRA